RDPVGRGSTRRAQGQVAASREHAGCKRGFQKITSGTVRHDSPSSWPYRITGEFAAASRHHTSASDSAVSAFAHGEDGLVGSVLDAIGNTPVVRLRKVVPPGAGEVIVKLEYFNPTGSYKDRMALAMIEEAENRGDLRPGMRVVEYTGGSTGS